MKLGSERKLTTSGPPAQALGVDPVDKEVMRRPPRKKNSPVLNGRLMARVLFSGAIIVLGTLFIYGYEISDGSMSRRDQTMVSYCSLYSIDVVRPSLALSSSILSRRCSPVAWVAAFSEIECCL